MLPFVYIKNPEWAPSSNHPVLVERSSEFMASAEQQILEQQVRSSIHWFGCWDSDQRQEFLHRLLQLTLPSPVDNLLQSLDQLSLEAAGSSHSLFRCQLRLFSAWFQTWDSSLKDKFLSKLTVLNPVWTEQFRNEVAKRSWGTL